MINQARNPWEKMSESSQRRIDSEQHDLFWITDLQGNYGFCLQTKTTFSDTKHSANLKGISILKRNSQLDYGELFLILNQKEDWQIFLALCEDLIAVSHRYTSDEKMISAVEVRLQRWQQLLKMDRNSDMTLEKQMGLFTELLTLKEIVANKFGIKSAVISWVGPDLDKQDFLLDDAIIEVKSFRTSRGAIVHISSLNQLISAKIPLFLLAFGLTRSEKGQTIKDLVFDIKKLLENEANNYLNMFELKLIEYGFIPVLIKNPLYNFIVDSEKVFLVSDEFPRILPKTIQNEITSVKYSIDLTKCDKHEQNIKTFLNVHNCD